MLEKCVLELNDTTSVRTVLELPPWYCKVLKNKEKRKNYET